MTLFERVGALLRANLNDMIDRAEDPQKMLKQILLDMENQRLQMRTHLAQAIADEHVLVSRKDDAGTSASDWERRAERAVDGADDDMARAALDRALSARNLAESLDRQATEQRIQVEHLRSLLQQLEAKLADARTLASELVARHRRARVAAGAARARASFDDDRHASGIERMRGKVIESEAVGRAQLEVVTDSVEDRFRGLERNGRIEELLTELKNRRALRS